MCSTEQCHNTASAMNVTLLKTVKERFSHAIATAFPSIANPPLLVGLSNPKFGDYQCRYCNERFCNFQIVSNSPCVIGNSAIALFKHHRDALEGIKSPKDVAQVKLDNVHT